MEVSKRRMYVLPTIYIVSLDCSDPFLCILQQYWSMFKKNPFVGNVFTCQYRYMCLPVSIGTSSCYCAFSVKTFEDKVEVALAGHSCRTYPDQPYKQQRHLVCQAKECSEGAQ